MPIVEGYSKKIHCNEMIVPFFLFSSNSQINFRQKSSNDKMNLKI